MTKHSCSKRRMNAAYAWATAGIRADSGFTGDCGFLGKEFLLRAEIRIQYQDGTQETVGTDKSWRYRGSIFEETDIYDGEKQNYLLWAASDNPWKTAVVKEISLPLTERYSLPLHVMEELPVREVIHTPAGETVLDFGQNFAGYVECRTDLPRGACMTLEFGEILQDGNFITIITGRPDPLLHMCRTE